MRFVIVLLSAMVAAPAGSAAASVFKPAKFRLDDGRARHARWARPGPLDHRAARPPSGRAYHIHLRLLPDGGGHHALVGGRRIRDVLWLHRRDVAASDCE